MAEIIPQQIVNSAPREFSVEVKCSFWKPHWPLWPYDAGGLRYPKQNPGVPVLAQECPDPIVNIS